MGFTTPAFIRKNTPELRKKLEKLGYNHSTDVIEDERFCIAALRDDSNYMQWFIADSILSVSYDDSIGNDHYFTEPKGIMFFWDENWNHETIISGRYHKATINELIEHFNKS